MKGTSSLSPATLGGYTLLTKLASGGMATVYVACKGGVAGFERLVAIKCCHPHLRNDEEFVSMFLDEARLAASIRHPNVVATLDVGHGELLHLVMEYIEGCSLGNMLRRAASVGHGLLPVDVTLRVMIDALTGLHAAHELRDAGGQLLNLVHRDVTPQNILVGIDGVSRITDFGIAFAAARSTVTEAGQVKGKFAYLAPEQLDGQEVTRRLDIFAAGAVLWEALTGRPLFRRAGQAATMHAVLNATIPPPSQFEPSVPREVDAVVLKALERDPERRYQTALEFAEALERLPVERATARAVATAVEAVFGPELAARRELIRSIPRVNRSLAQTDSTGLVVDVSAFAGETQGDGEIEHRRLRGLLAAAMLILVGSAIGLLLARESTHHDEASPTATSARPR